MAMPFPSRIHRAPVRQQRVVAGDGSCDVQPYVFCPPREKSVPLAICELCPRAVSLPQRLDPGAAVTCRPPVPRLAPADSAEGARGRMDVAEAAARTHVGEILVRGATCLRPDSDLDAAVELLDEGERCVPVVDEHGKLVGVVEDGDVLAAMRDARDRESGSPPRALGDGFHVEETTTVADVASACTRSLGESMPLSLALAVLADMGACALPVVNDTDTVVGVLSLVDVARWIARRMGYAIGAEGCS